MNSQTGANIENTNTETETNQSKSNVKAHCTKQSKSQTRANSLIYDNDRVHTHDANLLQKRTRLRAIHVHVHIYIHIQIHIHIHVHVHVHIHMTYPSHTIMTASASNQNQTHLTNWMHLVCMPDLPEEIDVCVFCGEMRSSYKKLVDIDVMANVLNAEINMFKGTWPCQVYHNIYSQLKQNNTTRCEKTQTESCEVLVCINCYFWTKRHHQYNIIPTLYLKWYMNTLHVGKFKCFDKRVLWRICRTLQQVRNGYYNFFRTLFTPREQNAIAVIAHNKAADICSILCAFYKSQTAGSMFHYHRFAAKLVRSEVARVERAGMHLRDSL